MININSVLNSMKDVAQKWHLENRTWFDLDIKEEDTVDYLGKRIIYHNYCIWHFIEHYQNPDTGMVLFVYDGGLEQNKKRNEAIELLDNKFIEFQKGTGPYNSETISSIIDRISVLYIKMLHMSDSNDLRLKMVLNQTERLESCVSELFEDMISGKRQMEVLSRFKTSGYNKS